MPEHRQAFKTKRVGVRIKICGFVEPADLEAALAFDFDAVGVVLDPGPLQVSETRAHELRRMAQSAGRLAVAVPGATSPDALARLLDDGFDRVQALATADVLARFGRDPRVLPVFFDGRDLGVRMRLLLADWSPPSDERPLTGLVNVDAGAGGGSGKKAHWGRARQASDEHPIMLAGGLTATNVADGIRQVRPRAVDVSSFTEREPGRKDLDRIRRFVEAVRACPAPQGTADPTAPPASTPSPVVR